MYKFSNKQVQGTTEDSGWIVHRTGRCSTTWVRRVKSDRAPIEIAQEIYDNKDFPGWTGVSHAPGLDRDGFISFTSTWDSGD